PAGERVRAGERLLHRVLGREAPDVHDVGLRRGGAGRRARHHALLRRLAGAVPRARGLPLSVGERHRVAVDRGGRPPGPLVLAEARVLHLAPDRHPVDAAALPLRPADAARVEGSPTGVAGERRRLGPDRAPQREPRVSIALFLVLAALTVASALTLIIHRN